MRYTLRPLTRPGPTTARRRSPFSASWSDTLEVLEREVRALDGGDVVIEVDVLDAQIRLDGGLRADVTAASPAVAVAFESGKHGPLMWRCDAFFAGYRGRVDDWKHNVRAIAMTLEALRAVDRYGAASSGEQYSGWKQIGGGPSTALVPDPPMTRALAAEVLVDAAYPGFVASPATRDRWVADLLNGTDPLVNTGRLALRHTHPDTGGTAEAFDRVQRALAVLRGAP